MHLISGGPNKSDVHLAVDVAPFLGGPQARHQRLKDLHVGLVVLKVGDEVERLVGPEVAAVVQAAGDCGQGVHANGVVVGALLEDGPALLLGQGPPCGAKRVPQLDTS